MVDEDLVFAHRRRALSPEHPFIRGTAQNPDWIGEEPKRLQNLMP